MSVWVITHTHRGINLLLTDISQCVAKAVLKQQIREIYFMLEMGQIFLQLTP